jgi:hypothetical protein
VKESTMSVKEARKRLGKKYAKLSDDQVEYLVSLLSAVAKQTVSQYSSKNL